MKTMREQILELALSMENTNASTFKKVEHCKDKAVKNAICAYAKECSAGDVLALMDTTLLGNGKNGFLLTETTLYSSHFFRKELPGKALQLDELEAVSMGEKSHICLTMKNGTKKEVFFSIYAKDMESLLEKIIALKKGQAQASAESKLEQEPKPEPKAIPKPEPKVTPKSKIEPASASKAVHEEVIWGSVSSEEELSKHLDKAKALFGENIEADIEEAHRRYREAELEKRMAKIKDAEILIKALDGAMEEMQTYMRKDK